MSDNKPRTLEEFQRYPFDEQLAAALDDDGEQYAASLSGMVTVMTDQNFTTVAAAQVPAFLWAAGRLAHKCGGSREKFLELAARAYDYSVEYEITHPPEKSTPDLDMN